MARRSKKGPWQRVICLRASAAAFMPSTSRRTAACVSRSMTYLLEEARNQGGNQHAIREAIREAISLQ